MRAPEVLGGLAGLVLAMAITCKPVTGPDAGPLIEAGTQVATGVCSLLEGVDDSGVLRTVCATVEEIAAVIAFISTLRMADAGTPAVCSMMPGSTYCATSAEKAKGVLFLARVRAARLMVDGGK